LKLLPGAAAPTAVQGKTTQFSVCYPETCSYVLETPQKIALSDLGGSYNVKADTLTVIVGLGGLSVVLFPGWTATCPVPNGPPNVFKVAAFGSALLPFIGSINRPVVPGFVIEYVHIDDIAPIGGDSLRARISGLPCQ
jgi:hypothetical protein